MQKHTATDAELRLLFVRLENLMAQAGEIAAIMELYPYVLEVEQMYECSYTTREIAKTYNDAANSVVDSWIENKPENAAEYNRQRPKVKRRAALEAAGLDALVEMLDEPKPAEPEE